MLPSDPLSFFWGAATVVVVWFFSNFFGAAGSDAWQMLKLKLRPESKQVLEEFCPEEYEKKDWDWLEEEQIFRFAENGYSFYPHPENGARCFRMTIYPGEAKWVKEWLMIKPGARKLGDRKSL